MAFNDILGKREVRKKIDPGLGNDVKAPSPTPALSQTVVQDTDPSQLLEDLREKSEAIAGFTHEAILEAEIAGKSNESYVQFSGALRAQFFDARELLTNPNATPPPQTLPELQRLQRELYSSTLDPRLPRTWDLWRILSQIRALQTTYEYCWNWIVNGNPLYPKPKKAAKKVRETLQRELRSLDQLKFEVERIRFHQVQPLQDSVSSGLVDQLMLEFQGALGTENGPSMQRVLQRLDQLEVLLMDTGLETEETYFSLEHALHDFYGSVLDYVGRCILLTQPFIVLNGVQQPILDFLVGFDDPSLTTEIQDLMEFERQVQQAMFRNVRKVEDNLLHKEDYRAQHARRMIEANMVKKVKNQQFLRLVRAARSHLKDTAHTASTLQETLTQFGQLTETLKGLGRLRN